MLSVPLLHVPDKQVLVSLGKPDPHNQVFLHRDLEGNYRCFHINTLLKLMETYIVTLAEFPITEEVAQYTRANHGIDEEYIRTMPLTLVHEPGLVCAFDEDHTTLIVDGSHRLVWRADHGYTSMEFYIISESVWRLCLMDVPPNVMQAMLGDR